MSHALATSRLTVVLAGNPNSGKTTIFNALTGLRQKVANYPGVTVEKKTGRCKLDDGSWIDVIDLPGTYSLISRSPDETIAMEVLRGLRADVCKPDLVIVVVDASNLQRNLYLVSQIIEMEIPLIVALNMMDVARRRGLEVSVEKLEERLGVPVVPVIGHKGEGILKLKARIHEACVAPRPDFILPQAMDHELAVIASRLKSEIGEDDRTTRALAERLLIGDQSADVESVGSRADVASLVNDSNERLQRMGICPMQADIEAHYRWIEEVSEFCTRNVEATAGEDLIKLDYARPENLSERVDRVLLHKFWGLLIFALVMGSLFISIFWLAGPMMDAISSGVEWLGELVSSRLPDGPINALVTDGIFAGVGAVVVFVPQIALLFVFISMLEDSGYLARAAFLMDRLLARVGLHGKSFIPLLSSFACAIPGILATRTMENRKDRLATIFIAPFMSCSARLPVYALLIGAFFSSLSPVARGGILFACYAGGILAAVATAWIFKRTMLKGAPTSFILELPTYKTPQLRQVARQVYANTKAFVLKAGTTIFCLSVILWAMTYYPRLPEATAKKTHEDAVSIERGSTLSIELAYSNVSEDELRASSLNWNFDKIGDKAVASAQLRHSFAGRFGHLIEPAIQPLGYDWKMGIGLVGAFAAREVFVSTMAITYAAGDEENTEDSATAMKNDRYENGQPVWTPRVAVSLLVWFVLAMQCMSTLAVVKRETGGWAWPIAMLVYMNALAYVVSLAVYQVGGIWFE